MFRNLFCSILILAVFQSTLSANDVEKVTVTNPSPYEVVQREFVETDSSYDRSSYGQPPGFADVELEWTAPEGIRGQWQCRTIPLAEGATTTENWLNLELKAEGNTVCSGRRPHPRSRKRRTIRRWRSVSCRRSILCSGG